MESPKMKTIYFKNGKEITVDQKIVNSINNNLKNHPDRNWSGFLDGNEDTFLIIQLSEISHIE